MRGVGFGRERARVAFESIGAFSPVEAIARAAAEFLASSDLSLVRRCEGTGCILLFYDVTKSHTRRWCRMAPCGNRVKAAAHYRRTRRRPRRDRPGSNKSGRLQENGRAEGRPLD